MMDRRQDRGMMCEVSAPQRAGRLHWWESFAFSDELIKLYVLDSDVLIVGGIVKFDKTDCIVTHRFCGYRSAFETWEILRREFHKICDLEPSQFVPLIGAFGFGRENIFCSILIHADVEIIYFDLTLSRDSRSNVGLQMKAGYTCEYVN